ncbi:unnamed protein product [Amoebophrya sp. A120]|nr:unnamed protein product [Amoebophrya sp. A120]|eukprot:GSA120T00023291001.1
MPRLRRGAVRSMKASTSRSRLEILCAAGTAVPFLFSIVTISTSAVKLVQQHEHARTSRTSAQHSSKNSSSQPPTSPNDFSYLYHGQEWQAGSCNSREGQSPIDFDANAPWKDPVDRAAYFASTPNRQIFLQYESATLEDQQQRLVVQNNGHGISVKFSGNGLGGVSYENIFYNLVTANLHMDSEHTFFGKHYPLELHLTHKRIDSEALIVFAVPVNFTTVEEESGVVSGPAQKLKTFLSQVAKDAAAAVAAEAAKPEASTLPKGEFTTQLLGKDDVGEALNVGDWFADSTEFFRYHGSFTVPPCKETVTWFVQKKPTVVEIVETKKEPGGKRTTKNPTASFSAILKDVLFGNTAGNGNFRETMPRNGREITLVEGVKGNDENYNATAVPFADHLRGVPVVSPFDGDKLGQDALYAGDEARYSAELLGRTLLKSSEEDIQNLNQPIGL